MRGDAFFCRASDMRGGLRGEERVLEEAGLLKLGFTLEALTGGLLCLLLQKSKAICGDSRDIEEETWVGAKTLPFSAWKKNSLVTGECVDHGARDRVSDLERRAKPSIQPASWREMRVLWQ